MFWSIKLPIVIIFYIGEILLSILKIVHVIKGTDGTHSSDNLPWTADDVKSGIYVIVVCVSMLLASILMMKYFNVDQQQRNPLDEKDEEQYIDNDGDDDIQDTTGTSSSNLAPQKLSPWVAIFDAYLFYIPEFFRNVLCCGVDSYRLARKRVELRGRKKRTKGFTDSVGEHMLSNQQQSPSLNNTNTKESYYSSTTSPNVNA